MAYNISASQLQKLQRTPSQEESTPYLTTDTLASNQPINSNSSEINENLTARCAPSNVQAITSSSISQNTASVRLHADVYENPEKAAQSLARKNQPKNTQKEKPAHQEFTSYPIPPSQEVFSQVRSGTDIFNKKDVYDLLGKYKDFIDKEYLSNSQYHIDNAKECIKKIEELKAIPTAIVQELNKMHQSIMANFSQLKEKDQKTISLEEQILANRNESSKQIATFKLSAQLLIETHELTNLQINLQKNNDQLISTFQNWVRSYKADSSLTSYQPPVSSIHEHNAKSVLTSHNAAASNTEALQNILRPTSPPLSKSQLKKQQITLAMVKRELPIQTKMYNNAIYQKDMETASKAMQEIKKLVNYLKDNKASGKKIIADAITSELDAIHTQAIEHSDSDKNLLLKLFHLLDKEIWT